MLDPLKFDGSIDILINVLINPLNMAHQKAVHEALTETQTAIYSTSTVRVSQLRDGLAVHTNDMLLEFRIVSAVSVVDKDDVVGRGESPRDVGFDDEERADDGCQTGDDEVLGDEMHPG